MKSSKSESRKRSRAITSIIKSIGRFAWNAIPKKEKIALIKTHIAKTKKIFKKEREDIKKLNNDLRGKLAA